jgi:GMP synthase (glutamine-hydrolysing)
MQVGILQCGHVPEEVAAEHGDFSAMFAALLGGHGFAFRTWSVVDMEFPEGPAAADAWLITGSKHGAYDDLPFIPPLETLIRAIHAERRPLVGVCFGHQIVAQALGGRVEKWHGGWSIGRQTYRIEGIGEVALNAWHQDQVTLLPPGARVVGETPACRVAALAYGEHAWTIQPHPEFTPGLIAAYVATRRGTGDYPDDLMEAAHAATALPLDNAALAARIAAVLRSRVPVPHA